MPPKRRSSTRGLAKKGAAPPPPSSDDVTLNVDMLDSGAEVLSDSLASQPQAGEAVSTPAPAASATITLVTPVSLVATTNHSTPTSTSNPTGRKLLRQPKFGGRPSQAKRTELQQAEEANAAEESEKFKRSQRLTDHGASRARVGGSQRGRGRGRGGLLGDGDERAASGPFSAPQITRESRRGARERGGRAGGSTRARKEGSREGRTSTTASTGGILIKQESSGSSARPKLGIDAGGDVSMQIQPDAVADGGYISSSSDTDSETNGPRKRINVEDLGIIDLTDDDAGYAPMAPVRIKRVTHRKPSFAMNADGAMNAEGSVMVDSNDPANVPILAVSEKKKGKQKLNEIDPNAERERFQGTYEDSDSDVHIKPEPVTSLSHAQTLENESAGAADAIPSSPDKAKRKVKEKAKLPMTSSDSVLPPPEEYYTVSDIEEWERHQEDLNILRNELGHPAPGGTHLDGDITMAGMDRRAENVYLFQFPPGMPQLQPISTAKHGRLEGASVSAGAAATTNGEQEEIHTDSDPATQHPQFPTTGGLVGKLRVHASGRVSLDWGGQSGWCVGLGLGSKAAGSSDAGSLRDIYVVDLPEPGLEEDGGKGKIEGAVATSLGTVKEKFVVRVDWEELLK